MRWKIGRYKIGNEDFVRIDYLGEANGSRYKGNIKYLTYADVLSKEEQLKQEIGALYPNVEFYEWEQKRS